jgi:hypothetical protein
MILRASSPLSPLPPTTYQSFSSQFTTNLTSGKYLKPKAEPKAGDSDMPQNPFEGGQMDSMMDGMKKQGVMM